MVIMLLLRMGNSIKRTEEMITDNRYSGPDQVRDQRVAPWFSIDHAVILDWLPVIGQTGYALYSILEVLEMFFIVLLIDLVC